MHLKTKTVLFFGRILFRRGWGEAWKFLEIALKCDETLRTLFVGNLPLEGLMLLHSFAAGKETISSIRVTLSLEATKKFFLCFCDSKCVGFERIAVCPQGGNANELEFVPYGGVSPMNESHVPFFGALRAVGNGAVFSGLTLPSSYHLGPDWVATGASRPLDFPT